MSMAFWDTSRAIHNEYIRDSNNNIAFKKLKDFSKILKLEEK